ncbi:MAG: hypothetical protein RL385_1066 [Pseudomonadota bacterium]|jgi:hypothetical protein
MHTEAQYAVELAKVGEGRLRQHDVRSFDSGNTLVLVTALAVPRLWGYLLDAALLGFEEGLARPHDGRVSTRLHQGLDGAQRCLRGRAEALIERRPSDVGLLALGRDGALLHVVCVGPLRAYRHGRGEPRLLTPPDARAHGLLKSSPAWSMEAIEPGDTVLAGTLAACSDPALNKAWPLLQAKGTGLGEVLETLLAPGAAQHIGGAAMAMRFPKF